MELVFNICIGVFLIMFLVVSATLGGMTISSDKIGPSGFPQMVIAIGIILLIFITYDSFKNRKIKKETFNVNDKGFNVMIKNIGLLTTYIFTMNYIGFILGTLLFTLASLWNMGYRHKNKALSFSLILTVSITLIFGRLFYVALPRGIGALRELSYFIY